MCVVCVCWFVCWFVGCCLCAPRLSVVSRCVQAEDQRRAKRGDEQAKLAKEIVDAQTSVNTAERVMSALLEERQQVLAELQTIANANNSGGGGGSGAANASPVDIRSKLKTAKDRLSRVETEVRCCGGLLLVSCIFLDGGADGVGGLLILMAMIVVVIITVMIIS
jgi:hypothetical protein